MKVSVPWPPGVLSPNARVDRWTLARAKKAYRTGCGWEAKAAGLPRMTSESLPVTITFHPPDNRRRDRDNMIAAMKSGQDGIADAIGVDDRLWVPTYALGDPVPRGAVVFDFAGARETAE